MSNNLRLLDASEVPRSGAEWAALAAKNFQPPWLTLQPPWLKMWKSALGREHNPTSQNQVLLEFFTTTNPQTEANFVQEWTEKTPTSQQTIIFEL